MIITPAKVGTIPYSKILINSGRVSVGDNIEWREDKPGYKWVPGKITSVFGDPRKPSHVHLELA